MYLKVTSLVMRYFSTREINGRFPLQTGCGSNASQSMDTVHSAVIPDRSGEKFTIQTEAVSVNYGQL